MAVLRAATASGPARPACIVDVRLALGRHGLRAVTALSRSFEVWLPQRLREILGEPPGRRGPAAELVPPRRGATAAERRLAWETAAESALWNGADPEIASIRTFFLGDKADECRTPPWVDRGLRDRCEQLEKGLDLLASATPDPGRCGEEFTACVRGAAALAAALPYVSFILTRLDDDQLPTSVRQLAAWGLVPRRVEADLAAAELRAALAASGVLALRWAGVQLAAVHVAVPWVPVLGAPVAGAPDERIAQHWREASIAWMEV